MNLFDVVKDLVKKKELSWEEAKPHYTPYVINKALSFDKRMVFFANEINRLHFMEHQMQFAFYQGALPKVNGTARWIKSEKHTEEVKKLAEKYQCSLGEAQEMMQFYSDK